MTGTTSDSDLTRALVRDSLLGLDLLAALDALDARSFPALTVALSALARSALDHYSRVTDREPRDVVRLYCVNAALDPGVDPELTGRVAALLTADPELRVSVAKESTRWDLVFLCDLTSALLTRIEEVTLEAPLELLEQM